MVFGVEKKLRDNFKVWKEGGKTPTIVFEFTSKKTMREDRDVKRPLYEQVLKVPEYVLFDPTGDYLKPRLQGFRLVHLPDRCEHPARRSNRGPRSRLY